MNVKSTLVLLMLVLSSVFYFSCNNSQKSDDSNKEVVALWKQNCALCHGMDGKLGVNGAKDLRLSELSLGPRKSIIKNGKGLMIPFGNKLSDKDIEALAKYTFTFK